MLDLKSFRENSLKMTQAEFAKFIDERQDYISRLENGQAELSIPVAKKIADAVGMTLDELFSYKKPAPKALEVSDTWRKADFTKRTIIEYISEHTEKYRILWGDNYEKYISELNQKVEQVIVKPKIAFVGNSDVGKSRIINSLIGAEKMPASWTPTTSITVFIKHIDDRPKYIEEEVWIFKASHENLVGWDSKRLNDEAYCRQWKITGGSSELLKNYGTRQGDMYSKNEAGAAVIFVDSEILKNCDIIDLPGFGTGDRAEDDLMTIKAKEFVDVLIYMSIANGFMREGDIDYLKESINSLNVMENRESNELKPLSNLFVVASQAHTVDRGNPKSLEDILDKGCVRLISTMPEAFWKNKQSISGYEYNDEVIRSRFFTYTTDIEGLRKKFENEIKLLVEKLPEIINDKAKEFIREYAKDVGLDIGKEIDQYNSIINERDKYELLLNEVRKKEPERLNENQNRRMDVINDIKKMCNNSIGDFASEYGSIISTDKIVEIIKEKGFKKKKEDIQSLVSYINSLLQSKLQDNLKDKSDKLSEKINQYLADFEGSIKSNNFSADLDGLDISFDVKKAFISGLAGLATFGGLSIWAASLGNLGAYILIAQGVSLLSALGISVGGTATAAAGVAAIGGPVVLGIALAILATIAVFAFLTGGWEKSIAKKIVKEYDNKNCLTKYREVIEKFWEDTEFAFNESADSLDREWKEYVANLEEVVSSYNIEEIKRKIQSAKDFISFLSGIPL